ncbi:MAG: HDOD domain-containing protein, partial [candidate division Zixibacteria bacterium]|nr:HDOD domain-containing protein [candidate division Zixibacteria bacterium]
MPNTKPVDKVHDFTKQLEESGMPQQRSDEPFINVVSASLDDVPLALGTVAMAVIKLMSDSEVSLERLSRAISSDQGLSARIIRKANSAFYATGNRITTLPLAIMKIGFSATRSIAIT